MFFLIYENDLPNGIFFVKQFSDDTSLFFVVANKERNTIDITDDLRFLSIWAHKQKMKMLFDPDPSKPVSEVVFFRKHTKIDHPDI